MNTKTQQNGGSSPADRGMRTKNPRLLPLSGAAEAACRNTIRRVVRRTPTDDIFRVCYVSHLYTLVR